VTGACNLAFLFIVLSGLYLWWPDQWSRSVLRSIVLFRSGLRGRARDFNWHNVIGFWCCLPLAVVVASAVPISYPWANDLVYRVVGDEPPARPSGAGPRSAGERRSSEPDRSLDLAGLDTLWGRAEQQVPDWQSISVRLPSSSSAPWTLSIDTSRTGAVRPDKRSQLTLDPRNGEVVRFEPYSSQSRGRRVRTWMRFLHTGEALGFVGQGIAGIASTGAAVLVWTGLALACRRFLAWLARRARPRIPERALLREGTTVRRA
jgi:uncharacterized iron-regulated membrane protein